MPLSRAEELTLQFYEWEKRGRGWNVFDQPVELEPQFEPFQGHISNKPFVDTGLVPTPFERISSWIASFQKRKQEETNTEVGAYPSQASGKLTAIRIALPKDYKVDIHQAEQFLYMLSTTEAPISFECIGYKGSICLQFVCREADVWQVQAQLRAYFPDCAADKYEFVSHILDVNNPSVVLDLGLKDEFMRPLQIPTSFSIDPMTGVFGVLESLGTNERACVQILFKGAHAPWQGSILASVTDGTGHSFFMDAPEMPLLAEEKTNLPLYGVVIRAIGCGSTFDRAFDIAQNVANALSITSRSPGNVLIPMHNTSYPPDDHRRDVLNRESRRLGMLLNSGELVNFVHIPSSVTANIERQALKTKAAPAIAKKHPFTLGYNEHKGVDEVVSIERFQRLRHMHVIGATGTGKSTLLAKCILQDIYQGNGCAVLDPHGDLVEEILRYIPEYRIKDVILVDPADTEYPIGFNILQANSEIEKDVLSSDLVAVFRRLSTSWGDQMTSVLSNAILALLESDKPGTLLDLRRFLIEKEFRDNWLDHVRDPAIVYYWEKEYPIVKGASIGPILTRLDTFLRPRIIRNMVGQKKCIRFDQIMDTSKILLVKLPQGLIGNDNSYLLGTLFVSKIYQAAMARQVMGQADRRDFFLYIDEFHNFITPSMAQILSGARKYHLGLILAHQDMQQLIKEDTELATSVMSNAGTRICFRLGDTDAKRFADGFSFFAAEDLENLPTGNAICRIDRREQDFNLEIDEKRLWDLDENPAFKETIQQQSKIDYATAREIVEQQFTYQREKDKPEANPQSQPEYTETEKQEKATPVEDVKPESKTKPKDEPAVKVNGLDPQEVAKTTENFIRQKELSQHRYLQTLIKRMTEAKCYKAVIEQQTPDGTGQVDVSIERDGEKIACEIGVTTSKEWELHNVEKCLRAGYGLVVAIANDAKGIEKMNKQVAKLDEAVKSKVRVMLPEEFFVFLEKQADQPPVSEKRIKGYRVKVNYETVTGDEAKTKRDSIARVVLDSIKRKKKEDF